MGRDGAKLLLLAEKLKPATMGIDAFPCDLTKDEDVEQTTSQISAKYGRLDILIHCAGIIVHGRLADAPIATLDLQYAANVRGPLLLTQKLLPLLKKPRGQVVFV